jgi:hypothetical protein
VEGAVPGATKKSDEVDDLEKKKADALDEDDDDLLDDEDGDDDEDEEGEGEDVPATATGRASAQRLLDLMVEKKALQLHAAKAGKELIEAVARAIEWPGPVAQRASKLSNAIVDSEDVDELFIDDETLAELLKRW